MTEAVAKYIRPRNLAILRSVAEAALASATFVYVFGYASWAVYAWRNRLGLLPLLEGQYLVAGLVPAGIAVLLILATRTLLGLRRLSEAEPTPEAAARGRRRGFWGTLLVISGFSVLALPVDLGPATFALPLAGLVLMFSAQFTSDEPYERLLSNLTFWFLMPMGFVLTLALSFFYVDRLFPMLPVEFGGPQPQCITLDIQRSSLSRITAAALAPVVNPEGVFRTRPLWLLFSGGSMLIVRLPTAAPPTGQAAFRVRENDVHAMFPDEHCLQ